MARDARALADFDGDWTLHKTIEHADGTTAAFQGTATWHGDAQGAEYSEVGHLTVGRAPPVLAQRRYRWSKTLDVFFQDGRFFHKVPPQGGTTNHWCDPDQYNVSYDFTDWPAFDVVWQVSGARKEYKIFCRYTRP